MSNLQRGQNEQLLFRGTPGLSQSSAALQVLLERDSEAELRLRDSPLHKILAKLEK